MSGHSKWKNTKRRKIIQDMKRGKIFNKLVREVKTAAKLGGSELAYNSRLRMMLERASSKNMAKGTLNRVIGHQFKKINNAMEDIIYEGYGPGGTALLLKCLSNNKNRIVSKLRHVLSIFGGNLGITGSVGYLFYHKGVVSCFSCFSEDLVINAALKVGANDITVHSDNIIKIYVPSSLLLKMESELISLNVKIHRSKIFTVPSSYVDLGPDDSLRLLKLIKMLRNIDDVNEIYHNGKIFSG